MSGLLHSLKRAVVKGDVQPDSDFIEARSRFEQYESTLMKLKGNVHSYNAHASGLLVVSSQISQDFTTLLDDPAAAAQGKPVEHEFSGMLTSSRQEHSTLASEHVPRVTTALQSKIIAVLEQELMRCVDLSKRIARRVELFTELGYYQKKVNELRDDRDKRASKGKTESSSDVDKFDRNMRKLEEIRLQYDEAHTRLMADLARLWDQERMVNLGPLLREFTQQEQQFAGAYSRAVDNIRA